MALWLLLPFILTLSVVIQGNGDKHLLFLRHVESKQNFGVDATGSISSALGAMNNCLNNKDVSPSGSQSGSSKLGNGVKQIHSILENLGKAVGAHQLYIDLMDKGNWCFETSTLKRAQVDSLHFSDFFLWYDLITNYRLLALKHVKV